jgi:5-methylcytosine-specific restriction endonuclease McrA
MRDRSIDVGRRDYSWKRLRARVLAQRPLVCAVCGYPIDPTLSGRDRYGPSVDHINGRRDDNRLENLQPAHLSCNSSKSNRARRGRALLGTPSRDW